MRGILVSMILLGAAPIAAAPAVTPQALIAATRGDWQGQLQYRDYQSNRWEGIPMTVTIAVQPDGVTTVRTARFDDGPKTGMVTITTVSMIDPAAATITTAAFLKGRAVEPGTARITAVRPGADDRHWTLETIEDGSDDDKPARIRETTIRDGDRMTTLKEVDPAGDATDTWLPRNRSVLARVAG